jgi:DNA primase catalytic core
MKKATSDLTPGGGKRPDFEAIKRAVDLVTVIQTAGVELKREGKDWVGLCPFHADTKPSLRVSPSKGLWRCMSPACGAAGNAIQFVAKKDGVGDKEAAVRLLTTLPGVQTAARLEEGKVPVVVPPNVAAELLGRVAGFYHRALFKADRAGLDYLASRNLADAAMLETFQVGYCNGTLKSALPSSGEILSQLQSLGVLNAKGNEVFYGRVTVPIREEEGVVVGLYGRKVEGPGAKLGAEAPPHLYLAGSHKTAFNAAAAQHAARIVFVESILDALSVWQAGERAVVPLYGAEGFTEHHEKLVRDTEAHEILLALDNDEAGRAGTQRLKARLSELLAGRTPAVPMRVLAWPEGVKDANAFFASRSSAEFASLIVAAEPRLQAEPVTAGKEEKVEPRENGFALIWPQRRYEVVAMERVGSSRLRATVKALGAEPGRFHVETLDLYSARARRLFAAEVARAFRLPPEITEADLGKVLLGAEQHAGSEGSARKPAGVILSEPEKVEAQKLGRATDLVGEIQSDLQKLGIIGEETNRLLLYLGLTSRKLDDPLAVQILSSSGAGKSHLQDAVLSLCPEEDLIKLTALTSQALFYKGEDALRHKCLAVEEVAGAEGARYAVRNLISAKKLTIEATIKNPLTGRMETQVNTVHGPTAVFETTTQPDTDPETKSRYLVIAVDESSEQTRAIVAAQRQRHTLSALVARKEREAVLRRHHAFQRLLRPLPIVNPYEPLLAYGDERLTTRRDFPKYLNLILAVAFLHQMQRPVKSHPVLGEYIEATLHDVAIANELAVELFGAALDEVSAPGRRLARQLADYVSARSAQLGKTWERVDFGRRELREALKWSDTRLRVHLSELTQLEYLTPLCGQNGSAFRYRLCVPPEVLQSGGRFVPGLKSVEEVRHEADLAGIGSKNGHLAAEKADPAGRNGHLAASSPECIGEVLRRATPWMAGRKMAGTPDLGAARGEPIRAVNGSAA